MEIEASASWPDWLEGWLRLRDYGQVKCRRHEMHYNTLYCVTCRDKPMCDECWKKSPLHKGDHHQTLQVLRSSRRAAIEVKRIRKFIDIKEIQVYSINSKSIVYLNPNTASSSVAKHEPACQTCKRKIMKSEFYFCSIACKVNKNKGRDIAMEKNPESDRSSGSSDIEFVGNDKLVGERLISANMGISSDGDQCSSSSSSFSFRKRSRKGIPRRAPLK